MESVHVKEDLHVEETNTSDDPNLFMEEDDPEIDQIWGQQPQEEESLLDIDDASIFYSDLPPLPDFPCMSSSSSSSSTPAPVNALVSVSSSSTASSSSSTTAPWTVFKSEPETPAIRTLSPTASVEVDNQTNFEDNIQGIDGVDCMDVPENFGYMDLLDPDDYFDASIFDEDESLPVDGMQQLDQPQNQEQFVLDTHCNLELDTGAIEGNKNPCFNREAGNDLALVFLEWLKNNKESVSAEDLRKVKIKKKTIECAAKKLGGGKEAMKQLLRLILQWVQANHLPKRQNTNPITITNTNTNTNTIIPQDPQTPYYIPPPQTPYIAASPAPTPAPTPTPTPAGFGTGYMGIECLGNGAPSVYPGENHQSWVAQTPTPQFPQYDAFQDHGNNLYQGYGEMYPHQYLQGQFGNQRLCKVGSSATKEARKKRMARQRVMSHFRNHKHQNPNNTSNQHHQNQNVAQQQEHPQPGFNTGNWFLCPPAAANGSGFDKKGLPAANGAGFNQQGPPAVVQSDAAATPLVYPQQSKQVPPLQDKKQGSKSPEKSLKFLMQKVLKQSDVGNLGRIVLPKKEAESHLPELEARDGITIPMEDIATSNVYQMRYRFWPNNKSRMYLLENTGDFVKTNGLQEGDFIVIYSDSKCNKFLIRGVKVREPGTKAETMGPKRKPKSQKKSSPTSKGKGGKQDQNPNPNTNSHVERMQDTVDG